MNFPIRHEPRRPKSIYRTVYLPEPFAAQIEELAKQNDTSFNHIVVSMIEYCLQNEKLPRNQ